MTDTKQKILDTAERLFGEQGFDATSMRQIITEAGVNLAAIHYHFGSKEELLSEVVLRKFRPLNEQRLVLLDRAEAEADPAAPPIEKVMEAFLLPPLMAGEPSRDFVKLMGRLHAEGLATPLFMKSFPVVLARFRAAVQRAVPELPEAELAWRTQFMIGAMAYTLVGPRASAPLVGSDDPNLIARLLIAFLKGGFLAPAVLGAEPAAVPKAEPVHSSPVEEI